MTKAVAAKDKNELSTEVAGLYEEQQGAGFEGADKESYAIPFLTILQSASPQCKKSDGAYIKGAEEGMLLNTVTNEIYDGESGVKVIPCHYHRSFIEWGLVENGGGFFGEHSVESGILDSTTKDDKNRDMLENGNQIQDTRGHYVLILSPDGSFEPALITMSSTQLKKSKQWMSIMNGIKFKGANGLFTPPMFAHIFKLTTVPESNDMGSWFGWKIEKEEINQSPELAAAAQAFREAVKTGSAKAEHAEPSTKEGEEQF